MWSLREREREKDRERERERERESNRLWVHTGFWRKISPLQPFVGILPWHLNMAAFKITSARGWQLTSGQAHQCVFLPAGDTSTFYFGAFVHNFHCLTSWSSHFSCHYYLVNWPVSFSLISFFCKPVSPLSIKLLATKASVLLTKKNPFVTFQSTNNATIGC